MIDFILILLSLPLAVVTVMLFAKFILLCRAAREEEFTARREAMAFAQSANPENRSHQ